MTEQEQRICIAETCGFQRWFGGNDVILCKPRDNCQRQHWLDSGSVIVDRPVDSMQEVPDYLHDLNAIHAAELTLDKDSDQLHFFAKHLWQAMQGSQEIYYGTIHSTARQRAEAFLKTIGKWKD